MANVTLTCRDASGAGLVAGFLLAALAASGCGSDGDDGPGPGALGGAAGSAATASGGNGGSAGTAASGSSGSAGISAAGGAGGGAGAPGASGSSGSGESGGATQQPADERPFFSFFVTSQAGLFGLPAGQFAPAPDPVNGYGGNLGGLAGADEICTMLARASNPSDAKTWRAFLSTSGVNGGERVDAIDRIGAGPWYDFNGRLLAPSVDDLLPAGNDGRPSDGDPELAEMFTDENGDDVRPNTQVDNHDTLTGSGPDGRLFDDEADGRIATCEDWTSNTLRGESGNVFGDGGQVPVGHSWPRAANNGRHWIQDHTINGCEAGAQVTPGPGAGEDDFRVGAGGGYGAIYCFALDAVAPAAP